MVCEMDKEKITELIVKMQLAEIILIPNEGVKKRIV